MRRETGLGALAQMRSNDWREVREGGQEPMALLSVRSLAFRLQHRPALRPAPRTDLSVRHDRTGLLPRVMARGRRRTEPPRPAAYKGQPSIVAGWARAKSRSREGRGCEGRAWGRDDESWGWGVHVRH